MALLLTGGKRYGHGITAVGDVYLEEICVYDASGTFIRNKSEQQPAIPPIRGICRISVEIQPTEHRIEKSNSVGPLVSPSKFLVL